MSNLSKLLALKVKMLVDGCAVSDGFIAPTGIYLKQVHLYKHSTEHHSHIPDDVMVHCGDESVIVRLRNNSSSSVVLMQKGEQYYIVDRSTSDTFPISFIESSLALDSSIEKFKVGEVCSILGADLIGVIPSNYCFYFSNGEECKFCEIWQTYQSDLKNQKAVKTKYHITQSIENILIANPNIQHLAITTGNIKTYDYTARMFCDLGKELQNITNYVNLKHKLATLMPPNDLSIIDQLFSSGFNKIYFPLEVFERELFKKICPGKDKYGYDKLLDALKYATNIFGVGNVYTNLVYGIQSDKGIEFENEACYRAIDELITMSVIPVFTIYHYGGYNEIGPIKLQHEFANEFFLKLGQRIRDSKLCAGLESVIFSKYSLSNTAYNEGFLVSNEEVS